MKPVQHSKRFGNPKLFSGLQLLFRSIRFRLLLWGTLLLMIVLAFFSSIVYSRQVEYQKSTVGNSIQSEANYILGTYREWYYKTDGKEGLRLAAVFPDQVGVDAKKPLIPNDEILLVVDLDGNVIDQMGRLSEQDIYQLKTLAVKQLARFKASRQVVFDNLSIDGYENNPEPQEYYFVQEYAPLMITPEWVGVIVGAPFDPEGQLARLRWTLFLTALIVLGFSLVGGYWLAGRLMQPVQAITRTAQEINANDLTRRLNLGKQDELGALADTFDRMLERLEDAFERQRRFTADASHDLRTPLTIVNLEVNHILEDPLTHPNLHKCLGVIRDENEHMTQLVNNLLMLARADMGSIQLKSEVLDFSELALDVVERLIPLSQRNGVTISTGEMPPVGVHGDRFYLSQMVANLVENAIKYGAGEERGVWIETGCREEGTERWGWLRVEDHGPGIAADHLPYLFDRFYRVDPVRPDEENGGAEPEDPRGGSFAGADGHGLGLSIVQWVARAHGGDVRVTSQIGEGTVFEVVLPVADGGSGGNGGSGGSGK